MARIQNGNDEDYTLDTDATVWITVGGISVKIQRQDDGVSVGLYPTGSEDVGPIREAYATYDEAESVPDWFRNLICDACGASEGQPADEQRSHFGSFVFHPDTESFTWVKCGAVAQEDIEDQNADTGMIKVGN